MTGSLQMTLPLWTTDGNYCTVPLLQERNGNAQEQPRALISLFWMRGAWVKIKPSSLLNAKGEMGWIRPIARLCLYVKFSAGAGVFPGDWHLKVCKSWEKSHSLNSLVGCVSAVDVHILLSMGIAGHPPGWAEESLERGDHRPGSFLSFVRMLMVRLGVIQNQMKWD